MKIDVQLDSNIIFIKMSGSLVASVVDEFKTQVQKLIEKRFVHIVFDMTEVEFVDSSGLGLCITTAKNLTAISGKLVCCGLKENVQKLFTMTKADQKIVVMASRMNAFDYMLARLREDNSAAS